MVGQRKSPMFRASPGARSGARAVHTCEHLRLSAVPALGVANRTYHLPLCSPFRRNFRFGPLILVVYGACDLRIDRSQARMAFRSAIQGLPLRVFAPHRLGSWSSEGCFFRCMGLFPVFEVAPRCGGMRDCSDNGLSTGGVSG
jgi:hypothetical protein